MPAKDRYHDTVKRALVKDGWSVIAEQYKVAVPYRRLWIDLHIAKPNALSAMLVEIKGFEHPLSQVEALANALGKFLVYQTILKLNEIDVPLYLAVPEITYQGILSESLGQAVIQDYDMKIIVFSPEREEVTQWII